MFKKQIWEFTEDVLVNQTGSHIPCLEEVATSHSNLKYTSYVGCVFVQVSKIQFKGGSFSEELNVLLIFK